LENLSEYNCIEAAEFPSILYKYMPEWPYALNTLITRLLYFSQITDFNDPFEGKFVDDENYSKDDFRRYFIDKCHASGEDLMALENILSTSENWDNILKDRLIQEKEAVEKEYGILCLSETPQNILMWSHYANSHKGVVIGIDSGILWRRITTSRPGGLLKAVQYKTDYPKVKFFKNQKEIMDKWFFTKYEDWKYEKEWRAIHGPGLAQFPKEIIKSVYFGAKFNLEKRNFWIKQIRNSGISPQMFQSKLCKSNYRIEFEPIAEQNLCNH